jgi:hypothetical protein
MAAIVGGRVHTFASGHDLCEELALYVAEGLLISSV